MHLVVKMLEQTCGERCGLFKRLKSAGKEKGGDGEMVFSEKADRLGSEVQVNITDETAGKSGSSNDEEDVADDPMTLTLVDLSTEFDLTVLLLKHQSDVVGRRDVKGVEVGADVVDLSNRPSFEEDNRVPGWSGDERCD